MRSGYCKTSLPDAMQDSNPKPTYSKSVKRKNIRHHNVRSNSGKFRYSIRYRVLTRILPTGEKKRPNNSGSHFSTICHPVRCRIITKITLFTNSSWCCMTSQKSLETTLTTARPRHCHFASTVTKSQFNVSLMLPSQFYKSVYCNK